MVQRGELCGDLHARRDDADATARELPLPGRDGHLDLAKVGRLSASLRGRSTADSDRSAFRVAPAHRAGTEGHYCDGSKRTSTQKLEELKPLVGNELLPA